MRAERNHNNSYENVKFNEKIARQKGLDCKNFTTFSFWFFVQR